MVLVNSITQNGITWNFTHPVSAGQYINGDYWVVASLNGGVELSSISPSCVLGASSTRTPAGTNPSPVWSQRWNDRNGSMINPNFFNSTQRYQGAYNTPNGTVSEGDGKSHGQGFHGSGTAEIQSAQGYVRNSNWAAILGADGIWRTISASVRKVLRPGESLVSSETGLPHRVPDSPNFTWTSVRRYSVLTCVTVAPADNSFRPAFTTSGVVAKESVFNASDINYDLLGNLNASSVSSVMPSSTYFNYFTSSLRYVDGSIYQPNEAVYRVADMNHLCNGYGLTIGAINSYSISYINTNLLSTANKQTIANYILQRGIDLFETILYSISNPISQLGLMSYLGGGGGQNNSKKAPLMLLYMLLRPGAKKTLVGNVLDVIKSYESTVRASFPEDGQLFTVSSQLIGKGYNTTLLTINPNYTSVTGQLAYSLSDVGTVDWRVSPNDILAATGNGTERKMFSRIQASSIMSSISGYQESHIDYVWNPYRQCCTTIAWAPLMLAYKAMGSEKTLNRFNPHQNRYTQQYNLHQRYSNIAEGGVGAFRVYSQALYAVSDSNGMGVQIGTINPTALITLYDAFVKPSIKGVMGASVVSGNLLVSGVESIGLPTVSSIYIDTSTPFLPGQSNIVRCHGLSGFTGSEFMVLFVSDEAGWAENNINLFGINLLVGSPITQFYFTLPTGSTVANLSIPATTANRNNTYIAQAIIVTLTGQLYATNALKFKVL